MPQMKALKSLRGDYGNVVPGQVFECNDQHAESLASRGLAIYHRSAPTYETKVVTPAPVQPPIVVVQVEPKQSKQQHRRNR